MLLVLYPSPGRERSMAACNFVIFSLEAIASRFSHTASAVCSACRLSCNRIRFYQLAPGGEHGSAFKYDHFPIDRGKQNYPMHSHRPNPLAFLIRRSSRPRSPNRNRPIINQATLLIFYAKKNRRKSMQSGIESDVNVSRINWHPSAVQFIESGDCARAY